VPCAKLDRVDEEILSGSHVAGACQMYWHHGPDRGKGCIARESWMKPACSPVVSIISMPTSDTNMGMPQYEQILLLSWHREPGKI